MNKKLIASLMASIMMVGSTIPVQLMAQTSKQEMQQIAEVSQEQGAKQVTEDGVQTVTEAMPYKIVEGNNMQVRVVSEADLALMVDQKLMPVSYGNNGGGNLSQAFDGNYTTVWKSGKKTTDTFKNEIVMTLDDLYDVDTVVIAPVPAWATGQVTQLAIYRSVSDSGDDFELVGRVQSEAVKAIREFSFKPVQAKRIKCVYETSYGDQAWAAEIMVYEEDKLYNQISEIFTDGTQSALRNTAITLEDIEALRVQTDGHKKQIELLSMLDVAEELICEPGKFDQNIYTLKQEGYKRGYSTGILKVGVTNDRQLTGLVAYPGDVLEIYVDVEEGAPLPAIVIAQNEGKYNGWAKRYTLKQGYNRIEVPSFPIESWREPTKPGGPIYLENIYTPEQQGKAPRIRIKGGETYPIYYANEGSAGVERFYQELINYQKKMAANPEVVDIVELVSDNLVFTLQASEAYQSYIVEGNDVVANQAYWQQYVVDCLEFAGIDNADDSSLMAPMIVNIRLMQPHGSAYAAGDHVGVQKKAGRTFVRNTDKEVGKGYWGTAHEIGHQLDMGARTWGEVTNNMWSNYLRQEYVGEDNINYTNIYKALIAPEGERKGYDQIGGFEKLGMFWQLELFESGYWPKLQKYYRSNYPAIKDEAEKRLVFTRYTSEVLGIDMSEHFKMYGFIPQDAVIAEIQHLPKLDKPTWYLNGGSYKYEGEGFTEAVNLDVKVLLNEQDRTHTLTFKANPLVQQDLLGYEIRKQGEIIGFTAADTFTIEAVDITENAVYEIIPYAHDLSSAQAVEVQTFIPDVQTVQGITLELGEAFNPLAYVEAYDYTGNSINQDVQISHQVDTQVKGNYEVTYTVEDRGITVSQTVPVEVVSQYDYLSDQEWTSFSTQYGKPRRNTNLTGRLNNQAVSFEKGFGIHANGELVYDLGEHQYEALEVFLGADLGIPNADRTTITYNILGDGEVLASTPLIKSNQNMAYVKVPIAGVKELKIEILDGGNGNGSDHGVIINPKLITNNQKPQLTIGDELVFVPLHESFEMMDGVVATDAEDGDITSQIQVDGAVDISCAGEYNLKYSVTDSDGNTVTEEKKVVIYSGVQYLSDREWESATTSYGQVRKDKASSNNPIKLNIEGTEKVFEKGIGTHATSEIIYDLKGIPTGYFEAYLGVDRNIPEQNRSSINFEIYGDGEKLYETGTMTWYDEAKHVILDLSGYNTLRIVVKDAGNGNSSDHADIADAKFLALTDKESLRKIIEQAQALEEAEYTPESWESFVDVLGQAVEVYEDSYATQQDINHMVFILEIEIKSLMNVTEKPDKSQLEATIKTAESLEAVNYTEETWKRLEEALAIAKNVLQASGTSIDQAHVNKITKRLEDAIAGLEVANALDKSALKAILEQADEKVEAEYEIEAWEAFVEMREIAREVYLDAHTDQQSINSVTLFLEIELKSLEENKIKLDKSALKAILEQADEKVEAEYEVEAWEAFIEMREIAREVYLDAHTDQQSINSVTLFLKIELENLEASKLI